jgi:hypothetical protein
MFSMCHGGHVGRNSASAAAPADGADHDLERRWQRHQPPLRHHTIRSRGVHIRQIPLKHPQVPARAAPPTCPRLLGSSERTSFHAHPPGTPSAPLRYPADTCRYRANHLPPPPWLAPTVEGAHFMHTIQVLLNTPQIPQMTIDTC